MNWIKSVIGGDVISTPSMTAGTGLMLAAPGRGYVKLIKGVDLDTMVTYVGPQKDVWGKVYIISGIAFYNANGLASASAI
jgi:hypothetical protein